MSYEEKPSTSYSSEAKPSTSFFLENESSPISFLLTPLYEYILLGASEDETLILAGDSFAYEVKP